MMLGMKGSEDGYPGDPTTYSLLKIGAVGGTPSFQVEYDPHGIFLDINDAASVDIDPFAIATQLSAGMLFYRQNSWHIVSRDRGGSYSMVNGERQKADKLSNLWRADNWKIWLETAEGKKPIFSRTPH